MDKIQIKYISLVIGIWLICFIVGYFCIKYIIGG